MLRNALDIPYSWLVRPRFVVFCRLPVEVYLLPGMLVYILILFDALLSWKAPTGFYNLRRRPGELDPADAADE